MKSSTPPKFWFVLDEKHLWIGSDVAGTEPIIEECLHAATKRAIKDRKLNLAKKSEAKPYEAHKPEGVVVTGALAFKDPIDAAIRGLIRAKLVEYMDNQGLRLQVE